MDPSVTAAILAASTSVVVAAVASRTTRSNQRELEQLRADLTEAQLARDARRDYEYEARKRLYEELEPVRFQFLSAADSAAVRVKDLARAARLGDLDGPSAWLSSPADYFMQSTVYRLVAPLAVIGMAHRVLTLVDLRLDRDIASWYVLGRRLNLSFSQDVNLAQMEPCLDYRPSADVRECSENSTVRRQGIYVGLVERAVDHLVHKVDSGTQLMSFGAFQDACRDRNSELAVSFAPFFELLTDFHPARRPVTWRLLVAQACLYQAMLARPSEPPTDARAWAERLHIPSDERAMFDWRGERPGGAAADEEVLVQPFAAAERHLSRELERSSRLYNG